MSQTQFRNAEKIWEALTFLVAETEGFGWKGIWFSAGQVARRAGMSYPTARKYLEMAYEQGAVMRYKTDIRTEYRPINWKE